MILSSPAVTTAAIYPRKSRRRGLRQTLVVETGFDCRDAGGDGTASTALRKLVSDLKTRRHGFPNVEAVEIRGPNWRGWVG